MLLFMVYTILRIVVGIGLVVVSYAVAIRDTTDLILQLFCFYFIFKGATSALFHFLLLCFHISSKRFLNDNIDDYYSYINNQDIIDVV